MDTCTHGRSFKKWKKIYMKNPYDKAIATDISTTVSDPEIKNAVRMTKI